MNKMKKSEKSLFVANLSEELKSATSAILIDYSGMDVKTQQELKRRLKGSGAKMVVVKNTLLKIAGTDAKVPEDTLTDTVLSGQTALVITEDDPVAPLSVLGMFAKEFEVPQMKVGIVENVFQDKEALTALSKLPGKDALLGQFMGVVSAPLYGITGVLNTKMQELVYVLDQASKKGGD